MNKLVSAFNIAIGLYFFILANIYFWGAFIALFAMIFSQKELTRNPISLLSYLIFAPFLIIASIFFFRKSNEKYTLGLILLFVILLEGQVYRLFFVTHGKLEFTDLLNLVFYGLPFGFIFLTSYLEKKRLLKIEKGFDLHPPAPNKT